MQKTNTITDVDGILVGHAQNPGALTGCTVNLAKVATELVLEQADLLSDKWEEEKK